MPLAKILTTWFGPEPDWYGHFTQQFQRFQSVHFDLIPPVDVRRLKVKKQLDWLNGLACRATGTPCYKTDDSLCDLRPAFGEIFASLYDGYEWWGWCDADVCFGDLDKVLLPLLSNPSIDVINFKDHKLSGCLALFRNIPETIRLYRSGKYREVFTDPRYCVWDEDEHHYFPGESFYKHLKASALRMVHRPDLMLYDTRDYARGSELQGRSVTVRLDNGRLLWTEADGSEGEALFYHFMSKEWPFRSDGSSRYS